MAWQGPYYRYLTGHGACRLLAGLQWMPTLNLEPGLSKPKAIKLHADSAAEVKQVQGTKLAAAPPRTIFERLNCLLEQKYAQDVAAFILNGI